MNRRNHRPIFLGKPISLSFKAIGSLDLRQVILVLAAVLQAVMLVFYVEWLPFALRLTLALFVGLGLLIIATVPIRGTTFERALAEMLVERFGPKQYLHQTAEEQTRPQEGDATDADTTAADAADKRAHQRYRHVDTVWAAPNFGVLLATFCTLLFVASLLAYATRGRIPGLTE